MIAAWIIAEAPGTVNTVIGFFAKGGLFMWPLLACSIVSVTTMILRGFALREKNVMPRAIESEIERLVPGGSIERLMRIVHHDPSSLARITRVALLHATVFVGRVALRAGLKKVLATAAVLAIAALGLATGSPVS